MYGSHPPLYGELGREPLSSIVNSRMVIFFTKFLTGDKRKLCYKVYLNFHKILDLGIFQSKWVSYIKNILDFSGMSYI